ncbi:lipid-A-disaccharide synthase [Thiomicrorhabdus aquaedulcis]|uniref:lipid-A-disaccharide synthase n=1 Tax=Thiomicrorhabdus aquaedulcis TaxID=2211106 RepID=UPI000FD6BE6A|nr:lipid-A-disaccharide synthase [Thiomicrorhabdus aquaedulcis]
MTLYTDIQRDPQSYVSNQPFVIAMVVGEASGDTLGFDLMQVLKARFPQARFVGIGGPKMLSIGFESWFSMEKLSVMGLFEVLKHLPELLSIRKQLIKRLLQCQPNVFIGIDAPDFNFKVEATLKQQGIKTIHYVGPSVWAWRVKRLIKIRKAVDGVLVLFPFEPPYYERYHIPVKFVGHPLANLIAEYPNKTAARTLLNVPLNANVTAILPGSRASEIERMSDVYLQTAQILSTQHPGMHYVIPCVNKKAKARIQRSVDEFGVGLSIQLMDGQSKEVLEACDQAIVTSGTATLECALMKRPMVLAIQVHPISYWLMKKMATIQWIGLPNILANQTLVTELIQDAATPQNIAFALEQVCFNEALRTRQIAEFTTQYQQLKKNASSLAADAIQEWAGLV